jgi:signal transduction histidine kinase
MTGDRGPSAQPSIATDDHRHWLTTIRRTFFVAVGYAFLAELGLRFVAQPEAIAAVWPAAGWAAGFLALWYRDRWSILAGVFATTLAANLLSGGSLSAALTFSVFNTLEPWLFATLLLQRSGRELIPNSGPALLRFGLVAVFAALVCGFAGASILVLTGHSQGSWLTSGATWAAADAAAIVAVAPFLLALPQAAAELSAPRRLAEFSSFVVVLVLLAAVATSNDRADHWLALSAVAWMLAVGLIFVVRFPAGLGLAGPVVLLVTIMALGTQIPAGTAFGVEAQETRVPALQALVLILAASALGLNVLLARLLEAQRARMESEHRHQAETEQMLRDNDRRKNEFIATLAHELRNPLAPVRHSAQLLRLEGAKPEQTVWAGEVIERQVAIMARLLDDLLDISRIDRGRLDLREVPVELGTLVRDAVETASPEIAAGGHQLKMSLPEEPVWFTADPVRLAQVLANLLANAAKFTRNPGLIEIGAVVRGEAGRQTLEIRVADPGIGIRPDMLEAVFGMFAQSESIPGNVNNGLGIGLALSRAIVELHGGTVEARSPGTGLGSEFFVHLPMRPAYPAGAEIN